MCGGFSGISAAWLNFCVKPQTDGRNGALDLSIHSAPLRFIYLFIYTFRIAILMVVNRGFLETEMTFKNRSTMKLM